VTLFTLIIHRPQLEMFTTLTSDNIRKIFEGTYTNWSQLGGPSIPITIVGRVSSSGTGQTLEQKVLKEPMKLPVTLQNDCLTPRPGQGPSLEIRYCELGTAPQVVQRVQTTEGAIGYVDLDHATTGQATTNVRVLAIDGNQPQRGLAENNTYPFWSVGHMYTQGEPDPKSLAGAFLAYMFSDFAKNVATKHQYVPIKDFNNELST
jgi:ABC-type phosphate transport system substrate-binding protein